MVLLLMECAAGIFKCHAGHGTGEEMGLHACTFPILTFLLSHMSEAAQPIEMMDESVKKEIKQNRINLAPQLLILFCFVLFCFEVVLVYHWVDIEIMLSITQKLAVILLKVLVILLNLSILEFIQRDKILEDHLKNCGKK